MGLGVNLDVGLEFDLDVELGFRVICVLVQNGRLAAILHCICYIHLVFLLHTMLFLDVKFCIHGWRFIHNLDFGRVYVCMVFDDNILNNYITNYSFITGILTVVQTYRSVIDSELSVIKTVVSNNER